MRISRGRRFRVLRRMWLRIPEGNRIPEGSRILVEEVNIGPGN
jgi:hypothetical protein